MRKTPKHTKNRTPHSTIRTIAGAVAAALLVVMLVTQLLEFDVMSHGFITFGMAEYVAISLAAIVCIMELLALPFLLQLQTKPWLSIVSKVASWLVALWWLGLSVWPSTAAGTISGSMLGDIIPLAPGIYVLLSATLFVGIVLAHIPGIVKNAT